LKYPPPRVRTHWNISTERGGWRHEIVLPPLVENGRTILIDSWVWGSEIPRREPTENFPQDEGCGGTKSSPLFGGKSLKILTESGGWGSEIPPPREPTGNFHRAKGCGATKYPPLVESCRKILTKSGVWDSKIPPPVRIHWKSFTRRGLWGTKYPPAGGKWLGKFHKIRRVGAVKYPRVNPLETFHKARGVGARNPSPLG